MLCRHSPMICGECLVIRMTAQEANFRILQDTEDRCSMPKILETCVDPMDTDSHEAGTLLNISRKQIAQPTVNV